MSRLFKRGARAVLGSDAYLVRMSFTAEKSQLSSSNKCILSMWNLSPDSRGKWEKAQPREKFGRGELARLEAGYDGELALIFIGNVFRVVHAPSGPDVVTNVEFGDGEYALRKAEVNLGLAAGASERQVANAAIARIKALGVSTGHMEPFKDARLTGGFTYSGSAAGLLDRITKNQGLVWSIQDNVLQITSSGQGTPETEVVLSKDTGLVGFPTKIEKGFQGASLLNPGIRPGRRIRLETLQTGLSGIYIARKVIHQGDTREGEFITKVEGHTRG